MASDAGKGSRPRPYSVSQDVFASNWNAIFGKNKMTTQQTEQKPKGTCGCGRSPTGNCVGWHSLSEEQYQQRKELYETGKVDLSGKDLL